jgi:hypothetical protein
MTPSGGDTFTFDWDTSSPTDDIYNITITASDLIGLSVTTGTLEVVIDIIDPLATIAISEINTYILINSEGNVEISGVISDSSSTTGKNSGVDETSISLVIEYMDGTTALTATGITVNAGNYLYDWSVFNPFLETRTSPFDVADQWRVIVTIDDNAGNTNQTQQIVSIDNTGPTILFSDFPTVTSIDETLSVSIAFNDGQSGLNRSTLHYELTIQGTSTILQEDDISISPDANDTTLILDTSIEADGLVSLKVSIRDNSLNLGEVINSIQILHPSIVPPTVEISSPLNRTYNSGIVTISLTGDADLYWYFIEPSDSQNRSWTNDESRSLVDGTYTIHAYGNDTDGNIGHVSVIFTIDTISGNGPPVIDFSLIIGSLIIAPVAIGGGIAAAAIFERFKTLR